VILFTPLHVDYKIYQLMISSIIILNKTKFKERCKHNSQYIEDILTQHIKKSKYQNLTKRHIQVAYVNFNIYK